MKYQKRTMDIFEKAKLEAASADVAELATADDKISADIDYIAMMTDVELPEHSEEGSNDE